MSKKRNTEIQQDIRAQSLSRKLLYVEKLPNSAIPLYDCEDAVIVYDDGSAREINARRAQLPLEKFPLSSSIKKEDVISFYVQEEEKRLFSLLRFLHREGQSIDINHFPTVDDMSDAFDMIEKHQLRVANILLPSSLEGRFDFDVIDVDCLWGAKIYYSDKVPSGSVYLTCDPDMFGRQAIAKIFDGTPSEQGFGVLKPYKGFVVLNYV